MLSWHSRLGVWLAVSSKRQKLPSSKSRPRICPDAKMCCSSFEPAVRYASPPVGSVLQRLTQLPEAIEVKLLSKSENRTAAEERKGKGRGGGQEWNELWGRKGRQKRAGGGETWRKQGSGKRRGEDGACEGKVNGRQHWLVKTSYLPKIFEIRARNWKEWRGGICLKAALKEVEGLEGCSPLSLSWPN